MALERRSELELVEKLILALMDALQNSSAVNVFAIFLCRFSRLHQPSPRQQIDLYHLQGYSGTIVRSVERGIENTLLVTLSTSPFNTTCALKKMIGGG